MIISFTGAQSTGKTTLLNSIKDLNPYLDSIDEVTRRIKREYNLPINEDGGDITQTMIMSDHIANIFRKYDSDVIFDNTFLLRLGPGFESLSVRGLRGFFLLL